MILTLPAVAALTPTGTLNVGVRIDEPLGVQGGGCVLLDRAGLHSSDSVPVLNSRHGEFSINVHGIDLRTQSDPKQLHDEPHVAHGRAGVAENGYLILESTIAPTDLGARVRQLLREGHDLPAEITVSAAAVVRCHAGQRVTVNGTSYLLDAATDIVTAWQVIEATLAVPTLAIGGHHVSGGYGLMPLG